MTKSLTRSYNLVQESKDDRDTSVDPNLTGIRRLIATATRHQKNSEAMSVQCNVYGVAAIVNAIMNVR